MSKAPTSLNVRTIMLLATVVGLVGVILAANVAHGQTPASPTIAKTDNKSSASAGESTTYTITLDNPGETDAVGLQVRDQLPGLLTNIANISDAGKHVGNTITWDNLGVSAKGTKTVSYQATISTSLAVGTTTVSNTATLGCSTAGTCPFSGNAVDITSVTVAPVPVVPTPAALSVSKSVNVDTTARPGDVLRYTVTVANVASGTTAENVVITDVLPQGFTFQADGTTTGTFTMGDIPAGQNRTLTYDVVVGSAVASGTYDNVSSAKASNTEQVTAAARLKVRRPLVLGETVRAEAEEEEEELEVQVLAETGPGIADGLIILAALGLVGLGVLLRRRLA